MSKNQITFFIIGSVVSLAIGYYLSLRASEVNNRKLVELLKAEINKA